MAKHNANIHLWFDANGNLMHVVITPLMKCKPKDPSDCYNFSPIAIIAAVFNVMEEVLLSRPVS